MKDRRQSAVQAGERRDEQQPAGARGGVTLSTRAARWTELKIYKIEERKTNAGRAGLGFPFLLVKNQEPFHPPYSTAICHFAKNS